MVSPSLGRSVHHVKGQSSAQFEFTGSSQRSHAKGLEVPHPDHTGSSALHIGHNPNRTSATMLVDSGVSHIVLKDVVMSAPNTKSFASLKSAKKGSELSAIGRGLLQIGPFCLQAFIFSDDELEDTLLGLDPLTEHGCTATIFTHESFHLYYKTNPEPILSGSKKSNQKAWKVQIQQQTKAPDIVLVPVESSAFAGKLQGTRQTDSEYVQFVHASLGFPAPTTFMNVVRKRFITGPNQYTRLTPKLVTKNMPNSMATARGHLDRTRMGKPHADSQSVSVLRRFHDSQIVSALKRTRLQTPEPFSINKALRSRTLHMDYTGQLQTPCTSGVQYFQIACWGHYIDIQPFPTHVFYLCNLRRRCSSYQMCLNWERLSRMLHERIQTS